MSDSNRKDSVNRRTILKTIATTAGGSAFLTHKPAGEIVHAYLGCRFELRRRGVVGALRWARRPVAASDPTDRVMQGPSVDIAAGIRLASITARVLQRVPADTRCLNQSLVLVRLLANRGVHGELALAVRRHEVAAHAWVEVAGEAVSPLAPDGFVQVSTL